jgi:hypothetical protein
MKTNIRARWAWRLGLLLVVVAGCLAGCAPRTGAGSTTAAPVAEAALATEPPAAPAPAAPAAPAATTAPLAVSAPAGDPLVYPGATPVEVSDEAASYDREIYNVESVAMGRPVRIPDGARGVYSATTDERARVKDHYAAALPEAGWAFAREWETSFTYASLWSKDAERVFVHIRDAFSEAERTRHRDQFGVDYPADAVVINVWHWVEN